MTDTTARTVMDELDMGVVIVDDGRRIALWNTWMVRHSGISRRTAVGVDLFALLPAMAGGRVELAVRDALDTGLSAVISHHVNHDLFPLLRGDGMTDERVAQSIVVRPTRTRRGVGCLIQIYDQTAAVERERKLRAQRSARYHAVVDAARDCFITVDEDGAIWGMNPATEERFGCTAAAMQGQPITRLLPQLRDLPLLGDPLVAIRAIGAGGKEFDAEISMGSWLNNGVRHFTLFIRDVTERNMAAENLRRTERIQALGALTGGVAHEFNNLLMVIRANAELVLGTVEGEAAARAAEIVQAADRGRILTDGLLSFARRQPLNPVRVPLDTAVEDIQRLAAPLLGVAVDIAVAPIPAGTVAMADRTQLQNALLNLLINARDAMPDGGRITITAGPEPEPEQCHIAVTDTGTGMTPEVLEKACEPFFTTKDQGRGTGLGLSMVAGFARQSGGDFLLSSRPGAGTTATIRLRSATADAPTDDGNGDDTPAPTLPPPAASGDRGRRPGARRGTGHAGPWRPPRRRRRPWAGRPGISGGRGFRPAGDRHHAAPRHERGGPGVRGATDVSPAGSGADVGLSRVRHDPAGRGAPGGHPAQALHPRRSGTGHGHRPAATARRRGRIVMVHGSEAVSRSVLGLTLIGRAPIGSPPSASATGSVPQFRAP